MKAQPEPTDSQQEILHLKEALRQEVEHRERLEGQHAALRGFLKACPHFRWDGEDCRKCELLNGLTFEEISTLHQNMVMSVN